MTANPEGCNREICMGLDTPGFEIDRSMWARIEAGLGFRGHLAMSKAEDVSAFLAYPAPEADHPDLAANRQHKPFCVATIVRALVPADGPAARKRRGPARSSDGFSIWLARLGEPDKTLKPTAEVTQLLESMRTEELLPLVGHRQLSGMLPPRASPWGILGATNCKLFGIHDTSWRPF